MKTINITSKTQEPEIFMDPETGKYLGFAGTVTVYDSKIYVDTRDGKGYDKVMTKLSKLIRYLSNKYNISDFNLDDKKQTIALYILEGIPKYDPRRETKLSTFLQMRINRIIINEIRNQGRDIRNATVLKTTLYSITCICDEKFIIGLGHDVDIREKDCKACGKKLTNARIFPINHAPPPITASKIMKELERNAASGSKNLSVDDVISYNTGDMPLVYGERTEIDVGVMSKTDIMKAIDNEEPVLREILKLICFHDYSVKAAAQKVGLSHTSASKKIKRLKKRKIIKEILNR